MINILEKQFDRLAKRIKDNSEVENYGWDWFYE